MGSTGAPNQDELVTRPVTTVEDGSKRDSDDEGLGAARLGTVLCSQYRLDRILGVGGMAIVYVATHRDGRRVAVKILHPALSLDPKVRARFLREGDTANSVDHAGAVRAIDEGVAEDGAAFFVMELLQGSSAAELWHRVDKRVPLRPVLSLAAQLLEVLSAAHAKSIIHRDIKPANLFVLRDGTLKVLDFGIARVRDVAGGSASRTATGVFLGTPAYMAPEQALARSREIDARTDIWAVGATLHTLLTGRYVHDGESGSELAIAAATTPAPSLAVAAPDLPEAVVKLVDRALAFDRAQRWPSAAAMGEEVRRIHEALFGEPPAKAQLAELLESHVPPASVPVSRTWSAVSGETKLAVPNRSRAPWGVVAGACVVAAGLAYWIVPGSRSATSVQTSPSPISAPSPTPPPAPAESGAPPATTPSASSLPVITPVPSAAVSGAASSRPAVQAHGPARPAPAPQPADSCVTSYRDGDGNLRYKSVCR